MTSGSRPTFAGDRNIAMKVPLHQYETTVRFYRDVLGLKPLENHPPEVGFEFGANQLWIDRVPGMSQAEIWLELATPDIAAAADYLHTAGVVRQDEIEPLPDGFERFWISSPASIIHMVAKPDHY